MIRGGFVLACTLVAACSNGSSNDDAGADAASDVTIADSGGDANPTDAGKDSGPKSCSGFVTDAGSIVQMFVATDPPNGDGGTIVDGIYDISAWSVYTGVDGGTGATGQVVAATQAIEAGAYQYDERWTQGDAGGVLDTSGTLSTADGGVLVGQQKCPTGPQPFTTYSTDGTNLVFFSSNPPWGLAFKRR